jgi:hypothetical protein
MRGPQFRELLADIRQALGSAGAKTQVESLKRTEQAIASLGDLDADEAIRRIEVAVDNVSAPLWQKRLQQIEAAELSEQEFSRALSELQADKAIKKMDLARIAEAYVGFADKKASSAVLLDSIKTRFYSKIYDRDANAMAKRATPW